MKPSGSVNLVHRRMLCGLARSFARSLRRPTDFFQMRLGNAGNSSNNLSATVILSARVRAEMIISAVSYIYVSDELYNLQVCFYQAKE